MGQVLSGTLRLVRKIADGGMGSVWIAEHLVLGTDVAVKVMSGPWAAVPSARSRFLREARMTANIDSPHVVRVLDCRHDEADEPYIVLELLRGENLEQRVRRHGPLSLFEVVEIVAQTCEALAATHAAGIVHRDLKPENVFLVAGPTTFVKLLDFGVAKPMMKRDCVDVDLLPAGTPQYMSPEHMFEPETTEARSDLFSLAAVAYFALTRRTPFDADSIQGLYFAIDGGTFPRPSALRAELPDSIDRWFEKALAHRPQDRFAGRARDGRRALRRRARAAGADRRDERGRRRRAGLDDDPDALRAHVPRRRVRGVSQEGDRHARACGGSREHVRVAELRPRGPGGERLDRTPRCRMRAPTALRSLRTRTTTTTTTDASTRAGRRPAYNSHCPRAEDGTVFLGVGFSCSRRADHGLRRVFRRLDGRHHRTRMQGQARCRARDHGAELGRAEHRLVRGRRLPRRALRGRRADAHERRARGRGDARRVPSRRSRSRRAIGDLATGKYAFAAVAKGEDCSVLATGCVEAEMGDTDTVAINMAATDPPSGACGLGASCQAARCVPANDNADPSVGAQCSLELLGAGPLANPVGGGGTLVSAPAIATTPSGFVIVYREIDPNGASARVTVLPVDPGGRRARSRRARSSRVAVRTPTRPTASGS